MFYQYLVDYLLNSIMHLSFQLLMLCMDDLEYMVTLDYVLFYFQ